MDAATIEALCDAWLDSATREGGISIGGESEQHRLRNNQVRFHELDFEGLRSACVGLSKVLLLPGLNTIVDGDHFLLWSWSAELLLGPGGPLADAELDVSRLTSAAVRAALVEARPPTEEAFEQARQAHDVLTPSAKEHLRASHVALTYLSLPLLEAIARRACHEYVDLTGRVLTAFPRRTGGMHNEGAKCSSVVDVLELLCTDVADHALSDDLNVIRATIANASEAEDGFDAIWEWRNSSLHGEASFPTIGGTMLTLALRIALEELADDYEPARQRALEQAQRAVQTYELLGRWDPPPWSYYPPYP